MHLSSPIPLPNPAAFEDQLLVKKKRGLDTPTPKKQCPSTPVRSPYMHHPHSTHHFNHPHPDSTHHLHLHQPRGLALCFDLASPFAPSSSSSSSIAPPSSTSASLHTPNVKDELKGNKGCFTELKRCSRSDQFITMKKRKLGTGSFGTVYHVTHKENNESYALKRSLHPIWNPLTRSRRLAEFMTSKSLSPHPSITSFLDAWVEGGHVCTLMELCAESLKDRLARDDLDEPTVWQYLSDIMRGVQHMHTHNVLHLDIKPDNILVGFDSSLKLTDFGISTVVGSEMEASEGDKIYMAPELLDEKFSAAADIFSVGITLYEVVTGYVLPGTGQAWRDMREGKITFPEDASFSDDLKNLIREMMQPDPTRRPTAAAILTHPKIAPLVPIAVDLPPRKKVTRKLF